MDLSILNTKKKANTGAFLHLNHPATGMPIYDNDDETKPVGIYLMGKDSDLFAKTKHKNLNSILNAKKKSETKTSESIEQESITLLADMTTGWQNMSYGGNTEFSHEAMCSVYSDLTWVREQAEAFVNERANFI